MKAISLSLLLLAAPLAASEFTTPHLSRSVTPPSVSLGTQRFVNLGLSGSGRLSAQSLDFMGDTLGSFSSLAIDRHTWRWVGDHYEGVLWTLPDRGRNDPQAGLFYDYAARLNRFRIRFTPYAPSDGPAQQQLALVPDGGLVLRDFDGNPFTGAEPGAGSRIEHGVVLPAPASGTGAHKISLDAESLQLSADGSFYIGDEYAANVYFFGADGRLRGVIVPPPAVQPRIDGKLNFTSLRAPDSGRRNNQGIEGMSLSPDGQRLFVALQSALMQDSAGDDASGRRYARVLVYDVSADTTPSTPLADYVLPLPVYTARGDGGRPDRTAAQSELRALNQHQFLLLARDANGLGSDNTLPIVYKSVLLVDTDGASNLAGSVYDTGTTSLLATPGRSVLKPGIRPLRWVELVNLLDPPQLARVGLTLITTPKNQPQTLSEKWEAMDLAPALDAAHPDDYFLFVGNDNDFIARHCRMSGMPCDSTFDNDNRILVYRLRLPGMQPAAGMP
ncbi:MAG: esterase-like activity of phytase family protein [Dyella sp.]